MESDAPSGRTLYRIVGTDPPTIADFTSGAERGRPIPRRLPAELHRLWDGLSAYATLAQARRKQRAVPVLGEYIAALAIVEDDDVRMERTTREPGHHTIWGPPPVLLASVVAVVRADANQGTRGVEMSAFYSLWDVEVGTSLGTYDSEDEALAIVDVLIQANGDAYAQVLDLGLHDDEDEELATPIAAGDALLNRLQEWRSRRFVGAGLDD